ncbi:UDP-N-acetylmuramoyl-L-alanyl-D-glutamate--2,6-diaminopimelate ligase [Turicibacter sanguinis]|uniref:UDP-N-acetylmuramoyl-L-alanyl-D-glutamate--2, 6-diaminopimelate ligase n=1 Tax=Turicibacter sanguinis TaxID=154288 RepID=UPI00101FB114|nr:UDP-N-acetylmuramoyl-L-alanyl-D-glutamate--2,6-diaminopimelate ligase [Turicibacter sanguinis]MDB8438960.1 UDP-N-acetylmuramoyl-L-alanyl-D-glutamate--2,6-diaminopimelate ligase [Turicibacter sanguinis]MDB8565037.1 UDP-N-acetylmuramoyl-L-alanyl-D-glutamate--2,6-diaminopimelate ligase [Turicibacter sanguinis]MTH07216.1 UDP-N-acetylmuramoyl-L-alanyl-D-glutamate--2,6-diaminopimelate ligase [Turicibacter sanguinis]MTH10788.1 UDP-N-acetylmuramoyl-L-alanyl-D-glutamate--2,6-diaminopimelate ligase [T
MNIKSLFNVEQDFEVTGIATDNRQVKPGDLFVCIKGYTVDGHRFAKSAEEAGAVAIVGEYELENIAIPQIIVKDTAVELPRLAHLMFNKPTEKLNLFGLTGTNGKTTTAYILEHLLTGFEGHVGYIGTNGIRYANHYIEPKNTTPEPLSLQRIFHEMVEEGVKQVAIEVSSHALELHRVDYCQFKVALFTNLTPEHLDFHPTMDDYFEAKYKLFEMLTPDGHGIVNLDDEYGEKLVNRLKESQTAVYTYGIESDADFKAEDIHMTSFGTSFKLTCPEGIYEVQTPLLGRFNVYNALGAMASAYSASMPMEQIIALIKTLSPVDGRMEIINEGQDFTVIVDYAHTPDGVEKVLEFVTGIKQNGVKVVIGCPGDRDRTKRPVIAKLSVDYADDVIFTTDDPHSEDPVDILNEMVSGIKPMNYEVIVDRIEAIETAINKAQKNDIVLIAGRGHEQIQYWKSGNIRLDDREVAKEVLRRRLEKNA